MPRLTDLKGDEVTDLFLAVQAVGRVVERAYEAEGLTISVQVSLGRPHSMLILNANTGKIPYPVGRSSGGCEQRAQGQLDNV